MHFCQLFSRLLAFTSAFSCSNVSRESVMGTMRVSLVICRRVMEGGLREAHPLLKVMRTFGGGGLSLPLSNMC